MQHKFVHALGSVMMTVTLFSGVVTVMLAA